MVTWLDADPTVSLIDVLPNESHESHDQHYEKRFCPKDDVYVAFSTTSKRKIITICQYPLNVGFSTKSRLISSCFYILAEIEKAHNPLIIWYVEK
jgi:hypothetical protein